jgi:hypothetical protein
MTMSGASEGFFLNATDIAYGVGQDLFFAMVQSRFDSDHPNARYSSH